MTDERDKVYGVLGLYTGHADIKPDYNLRAREVFVDTSRVIVAESQIFEVIYYAGLEAIRDLRFGDHLATRTY